MITVNTDVYIERSPEEVFAFISNFENNPKWQAGMVEARFTSAAPLRAGSTYEQVASFLGRRIESTFEVLEYEPGRMVKATTTSGPFPITFTRMVEPAGSGTHVSAIIEGDAGGFFRVAEPFLGWMVQRSIDGDYQRLKQILEASD